MLDQNDLKAIAQLMKENNEALLNHVDRKFEENNKTLRAEMKENNEILRAEMKENNEILRAEMKENNAALINQFNAVIESTVMPEIRAVAEGHQIILDRLPEVDKVGDLEDRVSTLEHIVQMQRQELNALKGA